MDRVQKRRARRIDSKYYHSTKQVEHLTKEDPIETKEGYKYLYLTYGLLGIIATVGIVVGLMTS